MTTKLRLQINDSGAWRNVVRFPADYLPQVKATAPTLAAAGGAKLRIIDQDSRPLLYWTAVGCWEEPTWRE